MKLAPNPSDAPNRLPLHLVVGITVVCLIPFVMQLVGIDFGSPSPPPPDPSLGNLSPPALSDMLHRSLSGSFLHTILEWSAFCTAIFTVILSFTYFNIKRDITTPILGVALFCAGMMDAFHTLAADRLIDAVADNTNLIPFTWAICRLFNVLIVLVGVSLLLVTKPNRFQRRSPFIVGVSLLFGVIAYGTIRFCATSNVLPETMYPTMVITRPWDVIPLILFLFAGLFIYPQFDRRYPSLFSHALIISTIPNVVTQLHMAFGSSTLFDSDFNVAHFLKIVAYFVPLTGLILDYNYTYRHADLINQNLTLTLEEQRRTAAELQASQGRLKQLNEELEDRVERRTEKLAQATAQAQAANESKSRFLANMSHELRTPLNGIMGYAQVLQNMPEIPVLGRDRLNTIYQCGAYLLALINDILDISKVEAGKMELNPDVFHLPALLETVIELCRVRANLKGVDCVLQMDPELPVGVEADEKRLQQVLLNLLGNGVKFTESGTVTLKVNRGSGDQIRFEVQDTGVGMDPEDVEQIFQSFQQVGDRRQQTEGTGLGLAICQKLVHLMGGNIQVRSERGVGSVFSFVIDLPRVENWSEQLQQDGEGQIVGIRDDRRPVVLVIDDKWENRSVLVHLLEPIGFTMHEAIDAQTGLELALQLRPDLIISDWSMPGMDASDMIRRVRAIADLMHMPLLVSSASIMDSKRREVIESGASDFLNKPVNATELFKKLRHHLQLDWVYGDSDSPEQGVPDGANTLFPNATSITEIHSLAMQGNMNRILSYVDDLVQQDSALRPFAEQIRQYARAFDDEAILAYLEQA
ncbi:MAG: ATP-binding protein [Cyanobacteria bacterium P01_C01_bin.89]